MHVLTPIFYRPDNNNINRDDKVLFHMAYIVSYTARSYVSRIRLDNTLAN